MCVCVRRWEVLCHFRVIILAFINQYSSSGQIKVTFELKNENVNVFLKP